MRLRFVDREGEMARLLNLSEKGFYPILFMYGPEGCGKTRLLRELYSRLKSRREFLVVYVDALESESIERAVLVSSELSCILSELTAMLGYPIGRSLAFRLRRLFQLVEKHVRIRGRHVVLLVDDVVRAVGVDQIDVYAKKMLELLEDLLWEYEAESALVLASTSEGLSRELLLRHRFTVMRLLWNLPPEGFHELMTQLNPPERLDPDEVYTYTSGNPAKLLELAWGFGWSLEDWLEEHTRRLEETLGKLLMDPRLGDVVDDVDALIEYPDLARELVDRNLVVSIASTPLGFKPNPDPEKGIGRRYAWQVNVYRIALKRLVSH